MIEINSISELGIKVSIHGKNIFMSYEDFPWFKNQSVQAITHIEKFGENSFHWPELNVDLTDEMIEFPEKFRLRAKGYL